MVKLDSRYSLTDNGVVYDTQAKKFARMADLPDAVRRKAEKAKAERQPSLLPRERKPTKTTERKRALRAAKKAAAETAAAATTAERAATKAKRSTERATDQTREARRDAEQARRAAERAATKAKEAERIFSDRDYLRLATARG